VWRKLVDEQLFRLLLTCTKIKKLCFAFYLLSNCYNKITNFWRLKKCMHICIWYQTLKKSWIKKNERTKEKKVLGVKSTYSYVRWLALVVGASSQPWRHKGWVTAPLTVISPLYQTRQCWQTCIICWHIRIINKIF
jgi:hypothetical protein